MSMNDFANLSKFLLGIPLTEFGIQDLPSDLVSFYFGILDGKAPDPEFQFQLLLQTWQTQFANLSPADQAALLQQNIKDDTDFWKQAQKLIMLWYTGVWDPTSSDPTLKYPDPSQSYPFALVWVVSQSHPRGITKSFGYWQYPPSETQS
jgi:hypothetical protein